MFAALFLLASMPPPPPAGRPSAADLDRFPSRDCCRYVTDCQDQLLTVLRARLGSEPHRERALTEAVATLERSRAAWSALYWARGVADGDAESDDGPGYWLAALRGSLTDAEWAAGEMPPPLPPQALAVLPRVP